MHDEQAGRLGDDPRLRLADACRRIIDELASSTADPPAFSSARDLVEEAAQLLARSSHGRAYEPGEASLAHSQNRAFVDYSPFIGPLNPLAPPFVMSSVGTEAQGVVTFGAAYEGPPGCVHGGYIAAGFDEVLGFAQMLTGAPGMTARLAVSYRSPTPLHRQLRFTARVDYVEGRKIRTVGELRVADDNRLCADAEGLFISMRPEMLERLMRSRPT